MASVVLDYLEETVKKYPNKIAFIDNESEVVFSEIREKAIRIATTIISYDITKSPVLVYLDKSVLCIETFIGIAYSGNFYSPIDTKMPKERVLKVIETLQPSMIITDKKHLDSAKEFSKDSVLVTVDEIFGSNCINEAEVLKRYKTILDTDILYVLFTSGSTGVPKGVIISHRAVVDYTDWISNTYNFDDTTVFANQAQLYFDLSIQDVYAPLRNGSTTVLIPNRMFIQPVRVWKMIIKYKVNTLMWIPSMLSMYANLDILANVEHAPLKSVLFCGEVMPMKQLNYWIKNYPETTFANLYGPTECTDACTYYTINRVFSDDAVLPMGKACENSEAFVISDDGTLITQENMIGELYMRGSCLSSGYYNNFEKTKEMFVQNPLNDKYPEIVYKTGDLVRYNEFHELVYVSRKDFQIKHRGYRIELGEIDAAATSISAIEYACCIFNPIEDKLILIYSGDISGDEVNSILLTKLQEYMIPTEYHKIEKMLFNINGKIDRKALEQIYCNK